MRDAIPADTDPEAYEVLVERWRSMSVADRLRLVEQMCRDVETIAIAGIRASTPNASDEDVCYELARRRYGTDLADAAFGRTPSTT